MLQYHIIIVMIINMILSMILIITIIDFKVTISNDKRCSELRAEIN